MNSPTPANTPILLVEADEALSRQVSDDLKDAGYEPMVVADTTTALDYAATVQPSMVVMDRLLAGESGLDLCRRLRQLGVLVPVLVLMARDTVDDRVACLEAGADDYFLKPYRSDEFLKLVRLYLKPEVPTTEQLRFEGLVLDLSNRSAYRNERVIGLTMKEFELLKYLMEHPREVLPREQILENVWGYGFGGESNVIEVYIRYLRLKLEDEGEKRLIHTVRGVGYVLRET